MFWVKTMSAVVLPGSWCQKGTGLSAYILVPEAGLSLGLPGPIAGLCWPL